MKKSLVALAVLAASGAAFAQSSVTVYGKLDLGVTKPIGSTDTLLAQAAGSRLGFRGTEDLGGGLKANFTIEHRFNPDEGILNNPAVFWQGRSIVGLQGAFGRVDMGRDYAAAFWTALGGDVFGYDGVASNGAIAGAGNQTVRFANVVGYTSPTMGGFSVQGQVSLKEAGTKNGSSLRLAYANGPIAANVATERGTSGQKYTGIGASYDLGVAKVNGLINRGESATGVDSDGMLLGLVLPMGAVTLKASFGTLEVGNVKTHSQIGLGARYALSKRTDVYTSFARNSKRTTEKTGMEVGLQHNF